ncbi:MAG TPA: ribosome maturation factor RimM [Gemmatimonadaceae bacterium]|nr:ribosome maturation factor RimM [Gemmatimonadaceae bacterium]
MPAPEYVIVGRVRKAHGIRGELVVESLTDAPEAVFAAGRRLLAGTITGEVAGGAPEEVHIRRATPFKGGWIVRLNEIADRNAAELWRERYFLLPAAELAPLAADEVYFHDLVGLRVELAGGTALGRVEALFELPQGLVLDVRTDRGTVMVPYRPEVVTSVDLAAGVVVIDPPAGLLD